MSALVVDNEHFDRTFWQHLAPALSATSHRRVPVGHERSAPSQSTRTSVANDQVAKKFLVIEHLSHIENWDKGNDRRY